LDDCTPVLMGVGGGCLHLLFNDVMFRRGARYLSYLDIVELRARWREGGFPFFLLPAGVERVDDTCFPFGAHFHAGYLVLYVDTGQGTARRLDNATESPLGHALPRPTVSIRNMIHSHPPQKNRTSISRWTFSRCMSSHSCHYPHS